MKTQTNYYLILFVYISLWSCQLITSHLTHSLIILTDSYINLFKILDILLGIVHLRSQKQLLNQQKLQAYAAHDDQKPATKCLAGSILDCICTYQFKRLPLLGSFVNGLFLSALLMSAAIEGIQTCLHVGHSEGDTQSTILTQNPLAYPLTLIGFAIVGLVMQYCSMKTHEMRDEELCSESLMDMRQHGHTEQAQQAATVPLELNVNKLQFPNGMHNSFNLSLSLQNIASRHKKFKLQMSNANRLSLELPQDKDELKIQQISLRSLNDLDAAMNTESQAIVRTTKQIDTEANDNLASGRQFASRRDTWFWIRYLSSPLALISCAVIILLQSSSIITEVSDATLALLVVVLLFAASCPPMKSAGRVLLQTVPNGIDLACLEQRLKGTSVYIKEVKELHVWSLTPRSNRVATCKLVLSAQLATAGGEAQIARILNEVKYILLEQNIRCTTIEPILEICDGKLLSNDLK